jgi:hypothetical protein
MWSSIWPLDHGGLSAAATAVRSAPRASRSWGPAEASLSQAMIHRHPAAGSSLGSARRIGAMDRRTTLRKARLAFSGASGRRPASPRPLRGRPPDHTREEGPQRALASAPSAQLRMTATRHARRACRLRANGRCPPLDSPERSALGRSAGIRSMRQDSPVSYLVRLPTPLQRKPLQQII